MAINCKIQIKGNIGNVPVVIKPDNGKEFVILSVATADNYKSYQDSYSYQVVYPKPGKFYPKLRQQLNYFLYQWLKNNKMQGHELPR